MNPGFPIINHIDDVLPAIEGREDFVHGERGGFQFLDYVVTFPDTFPDPLEDGISPEERQHRLLRRECRGIKFYTDGTLAARPFHKFFNIGEKYETQLDVIDWTEDFVIYDKLDGSMIHPLLLDGQLNFCTKMGITEVAEAAMEFAVASDLAQKSNYLEFCKICVEYGATPLFEWCTSDPYRRIVIKHPEDKLVLTAIRYNRSGNYASRAAMVSFGEQFRFPVVNTWDGNWQGVGRFLDDVKQLVDAEGYVLDFDGAKYKTKGVWYVAIHRAKDAIQYEKDVVALIIDGKLDDVLPEVLDTDRDRLERFHRDFWRGVLAHCLEVQKRVDEIVEDCPHDEVGPRKRWIAERITSEFKDPDRGLAFTHANGKSLREHVLKALRIRTGSGPRLRAVSELFGGINWLDY